MRYGPNRKIKSEYRINLTQYVLLLQLFAFDLNVFRHLRFHLGFFLFIPSTP
jgi:hypothetical protein